MSATARILDEILKRAKDEKPVTLGGDPELFLTRVETDPDAGREAPKVPKTRIVPSCGLIGGEKGRGIQISDVSTYHNFTWHEDNVTVEFNFPPAANATEFLSRVSTTRDLALKALKAKGLGLATKTTHRFREEVLRKNPKSMEMGCEPDFCAYDKGLKRSPFTANDLGPMRFCGGHLHIGLENEQQIPAYALAMFADAFISLPFLPYDKQGERRKFYGRAGLFRPKSYGFEYRTMSNWWATGQNQDACKHMAEQALCLFTAIQRRPVEASKAFSKIPFADVRTAIDTENVKDAHLLFADITGRYARLFQFDNPAAARLRPRT